MRFYVGSSFSNIEEVRFIRDRLIALDHSHTRFQYLHNVLSLQK